MAPAHSKPAAESDRLHQIAQFVLETAIVGAYFVYYLFR
jgi:hypothetical protein